MNITCFGSSLMRKTSTNTKSLTGKMTWLHANPSDVPKNDEYKDSSNSDSFKNGV